MTNGRDGMTNDQNEVQTSETREERLAALKSKVLAGTYHLPADALADCLLRHMRRGRETSEQAYATKD